MCCRVSFPRLSPRRRRKAGIQRTIDQAGALCLDSRLRGNDKVGCGYAALGLESLFSTSAFFARMCGEGCATDLCNMGLVGGNRFRGSLKGNNVNSRG